MTRELTVQTDDDADIGSHTIEAKVSLENYPDIFTLTTFQVDIIYCIVTDMDQAIVPAQFYNVYTPTLAFGTSFFTLTPECGYTLEYEIRLKDVATGLYSPLPAWLQNTADLDFEVQTDDPLNVGVYHISIFGRVPTTFMNPIYEEELLIELKVANECLIDEITPLDTIADQLYYIDEDGTQSF